MLVTLKEILEIAEHKKIAIGAFNTPNLESLIAIIGAAEELKLPVIIQFAQVHESLIPLKLIGPIMVDFARKATVPVCVHLDHGVTMEYITEALECGFTGVMYDGSELPYNENLENTKKAVELAKKYNASVEAELGSMGKSESGADEAEDNKIYTNPDEAKAFVKNTGIDALACSFGTTHGIYLSEPKLDFTVVDRVRVETKEIPVVMHGGSGVSEDDYHKAIKSGVRKINYFTYMDKAGGSAVAEYVKNEKEDANVFYSIIALKGQEAMKENVKNAMRTFAFVKE